MRAFLAVELPPAIQTRMAEVQRRFAEAGADVKWVEPRNLHVTVRFLGEIDEPQRRTVEALAALVASRTAPLPLRLSRVGAFPSLRAPRVVWVGLSEDREAVARIAQAIEREGTAIGLRREERPFSPHLTLGRVRSSRHLAALTQRLSTSEWRPPPPWRVSSLTLYQSVLGATGPTYTVLGEFALGAIRRRGGA